MAMNKQEQREMQQLRKELTRAKAFRRTESVETDIAIPSWRGAAEPLTKGWLYNAYLANPRVEVACSSSVHHSFGQNDKTTTQGARELYSTKHRALLALRYEIEEQCVDVLANIDAMIDAAKETSNDPQG